jgi:hypothetical protein
MWDALAGLAPSLVQLMALAVPGWHDDAGGRLQSVDLPPQHGHPAGWHAGANRVLAEPRLLLHGDADHLTLIAGLVPAGADGRPAADQLAPMALAAYPFERRGGAWQPAGSRDVFALRGFSGNATLHAVTLSGGRQAVAVEYGSCFQGYCGTWLALYESDKGTMRHEPAVELALSGTNVDGAADCARRLQPSPGPAPQHAGLRSDGAALDAHDCYAIESSWTIDPAGDLVIRYRGAISRAEQQMQVTQQAARTIDQRQVLRYGNGRYRAVSGFNPVPQI